MAQPLLLVVDDQEDNRVLLRAMLEHAGLAVMLAERGEEAIEVAGAHQPTLILMDLHMPQLDGLETARRLSADPLTETIPLIAVTADALVAESELVAAGFCGVIRLPELPSRIVEMIRWCIEHGMEKHRWTDFRSLPRDSDSGRH
jgi:CheY-like chemotaxis protein